MMRTNSWGYPGPNGSFDGMMGQLERRQIDIGGSPAFWKLERARVSDFVIEAWGSRLVNK